MASEARAVKLSWGWMGTLDTYVEINTLEGG